MKLPLESSAVVAERRGAMLGCGRFGDKRTTRPLLKLVRAFSKAHCLVSECHHLFVHGISPGYMKPDRLIPMRYIEMAGRALRPPETEAFALASPDPSHRPTSPRRWNSS